MLSLAMGTDYLMIGQEAPFLSCLLYFEHAVGAPKRSRKRLSEQRFDIAFIVPPSHKRQLPPAKLIASRRGS
eukprot:654037-Amphidinium_carterae.1